jgi:D-threo-aldose 1-dehydrogenase
MRMVHLDDTGIVLSRMGFGCSGIMGRLGSRESARLIDAALDAGITHFDTARMYGYGDAEKALARILSARRGRVTTTTKVGILPPSRSPLKAAVRAAARHVVRLQPRLRSLIRRGAEGAVQHGVFDIPSIRTSFETSLRELGTDHVDILLLHECGPEDLRRPELVEFLEGLRQQGSIREFGIATTMERTRECLPILPGRAKVVQIPSSAWDGNAAEVRSQTSAGIITHSSMGARFAELCATMDADPEMKRRWSKELGFDVGDRRRLGRAFLVHALDANREGCVLFSSTDTQTIFSNVALASMGDPSIGRILASLVQRDAAPRRASAA